MLREFSIAYRDDPNRELALECHLQLLKLEVFESIKQGKLSALPAVADRSIELLKTYSDNNYVLSTIDLIIESLNLYDSNAGTTLMREISSRTAELESPANQQFIRLLADRVKISETRYDQLFENFWVNGDTGRRDLLEITMKLATDLQGGKFILKQVGEVMNWLEQNKLCDQCHPIYLAMLESAESRADQETQSLARTMAENGIKRCNLAGTKLQLNGRLISGDLIDPKDFRNRVVILLFWSAKSAETFRDIKKFHTECIDLLSRGVSVLAVNTDDQIDETLAILCKQIRHFQIVTNSAGNETENSIVEQCGIDHLPHAIIVDRNGIVVEANLPLEELPAKANFQIRQKAKSQPEKPASDNQ